MKNIARLILTFLFLFPSFIPADENIQINTDNLGSEDIDSIEKQGNNPFSFEIQGDAIGKARFKKWFLDDQHFEYRDIVAELGAVFYYDPCYKEALQASLSYEYIRFVWGLNPYFNETHFHTVSPSLSFSTERFPNWIWRGQVDINLDGKHPDFCEYANYDFVLWGRYSYYSNLGVHMGIIAQTGMKIDHVYPIIGFDWEINDSWKLNLVYPVNLSLEYILNCNWSLAIAARFFDHRQRVGKDEPLSRGLWLYHGWGLEGGINYEVNSSLSANIHAGWTFNPKITIANRHYQDKHHYTLDSSAYFGGEFETRF